MSREHQKGCIPSRITSPWLSSSLGEVDMRMSITRQRAIGWSLIVLGVCIAVLSQKIVFPGLEALLGIETIVGRESVVYQPDGSYMFTNPGAMVRWIVSVAVVGIAVASGGGCFLLLSRRAHRPV
jgi:hypothetical protein